jgi:hypothetical protein
MLSWLMINANMLKLDIKVIVESYVHVGKIQIKYINQKGDKHQDYWLNKWVAEIGYISEPKFQR